MSFKFVTYILIKGILNHIVWMKPMKLKKVKQFFKVTNSINKLRQETCDPHMSLSAALSHEIHFHPESSEPSPAHNGSSVSNQEPTLSFGNYSEILSARHIMGVKVNRKENLVLFFLNHL